VSAANTEPSGLMAQISLFELDLPTFRSQLKTIRVIAVAQKRDLCTVRRPRREMRSPAMLALSSRQRHPKPAQRGCSRSY